MSKIIQSFEAKELKKRPFIIKTADSITSFFGSAWFLILNLGIFILWIVANQGLIPGIPVFDEFPYLFLTTGVSLEAIILTIIVLISQQRQSQITKIREELDMQVNKIAEKEITKALFILKKIAQKQGINLDGDKELDEMLRGIEFSYIEKKLEEQLANKPRDLFTEVKQVVQKLNPSSPD